MSDKISYVTNRLGWFLIFLAASALGSCSSSTKKDGVVPKVLVIGLDGIPYSTFKKLQDGGHFRAFQPVSPMVASFPSISDPNWSTLMGFGPEVGFTKAFFDPRIKTKTGMGAETGGLTTHLLKHPAFEDHMDFKVEGIWEHLTTFIWTDTTAKYWLESLEDRFFDFRGRNTYFAFIVNTDLLSHTAGEQALLKYLARIEETVDRIQKRYTEEYGGALEVVLVSDHGNAYFSPVDVPLEGDLQKLGWRVHPTIEGPRDVGFYVPELLSFGAFYCQPASTRDLAVALSKVSHIQSTIYESGPHEVHVLANGGTSEAVVSFNPKENLIRYKVLRGKDPYDQEKYFKKGPLSPLHYFQKSSRDVYPYAAMRVWEGMYANSQLKPHVLANAELGYVFGNKALRLLTDIRGFASAHGSLHRDESLGIFVSTKRALPTIRPQDFMKFVDLPPGAKSPAPSKPRL